MSPTEFIDIEESISPSPTEFIDIEESLSLSPTEFIDIEESPSVSPTEFIDIEESISPSPTEFIDIEESLSLSPTEFIDIEESPSVSPTEFIDIQESLSPSFTEFTDIEENPSVSPTEFVDIEESPSISPTEFIDAQESSILSFQPSVIDTFTNIIESSLRTSSTPNIFNTEEIEFVSPTEELAASDFELSTSFETLEVEPSSEFESSSSEVESIVIEPTLSSAVEQTIPTTLVSFVSSTTASSEALLPSPTPTPAVCNVSNSLHPLVPFDITVSGYGFRNSTELSSSLNESFLINILPIPRLGLSSPSQSSELTVALEETSLGSLTLVHTSSTILVEITGALSVSNTSVDRPMVYAIVQAKYSNLNPASEVDVTVMVMNESFHCSISSSRYNWCIVPLVIPTHWFNTRNDSSVQVNAIAAGQNNSVPIGTLVLEAHSTPYEPDNIFMVGPSSPVRPGEEVEVQVYAAFDVLLFVYSLDCNTTGADNIDAKASFEWSLLTNHLNGSRLTATGFRVYNQYNTSSTGRMRDSLFNLILRTSTAYSGDNIQITCNHARLAFTNGSETPGSSSTLRINFVVDQIIEIFAYAPQSELLSIPSLAAYHNSSIPLTIRGFSSSGNITEVAAFCQSMDEDVIQVEPDCSAVYFSGSETSGAERAEIEVSLENRLYTSIYFRVLYVHNISLEIEDTELNRIVSSCSDTLYQRSPVSISGIATNTRISLTNYLAKYLLSSDSAVANVTDGEVIGVGEGMANISLSIMEGVVGRVNVSNNPVCVYSLEVLHFSDVSVENVGNQQPLLVSIALQQQYQYILSNLTLVAVATFSDGRMMRISQNNGISFKVDHEDLNQTSYNQFIIRRPRPKFNITATWSSVDCEVISREVPVSVSLETPSLNVTASSPTLAYERDPAAEFEAPTSLELFVNVQYSDRLVRVVSTDPAVSIDCPANLYCNDGFLITAKSTFMNKEVIQVNYTMDTILTGTVEIIPEYATQLILEARLPGMSGPIYMLNRVGNSGRYLMATVSAVLHFSTSRLENVTSRAMLDYLTFPPDVDLDQELLVQGIIMASSNSSLSSNITVMGILQFNFRNISGQLTVMLSGQTVRVSRIDSISLTESPNINELYIDCAVTLEGGIQLTQTFRNATILFPNLISFSITEGNEAVARVTSNGVLMLLKNSNNPINLMATVTNYTVNSSTMFYSNLKPRIGEADLGKNENLSKPLTDVIQNESFTVPVILNSEQNSSGVYQVKISIIPEEALKVDQVVQAEDWRNGSLVYFENPGLVTVGGVLNTGAKGSLIRLANVTFTASHSYCGKVTFSIEVEQMFAANRGLASLLPMETVTNSVELQIVPLNCVTRKRRSADIDQHHVQRRQASTGSTLAGDITRDGIIDLRDLYELQERVSDAVLDPNSEPVDLSQISVIEQSSLGLNFTVDVAYSYFLNSSNGECMLLINGSVTNSANSSFATNTDLIHVLLMFTSNDSTFLNTFDSFNSVGDSKMGLLEPELSASGFFEVSGNTSSSSIFEVVVYIIVEIGDPSGNVLALVDSSFSREVDRFRIADEEDRCSISASTTVAPIATSDVITVQTSIPETSIESIEVNLESTSFAPRPTITIDSFPATTSAQLTTEIAPESSSVTEPVTSEVSFTSTSAEASLTPLISTLQSTTVESSLTSSAMVEDVTTTQSSNFQSSSIFQTSSDSTFTSTLVPTPVITTNLESTSEVTTETATTMRQSTSEPTSEPTNIETTEPTIGSDSASEETTDDIEAENGQSSPSLPAIFGSMAVVVIILVVFIAITAFVICRQKRQSKERYSPGSAIENHRLSNRLSENFFYNAEEGIVSLFPSLSILDYD